MYGRGTCDMKGGVAVALKLAHGVTSPNRDVTYVFYDGEEIAAVHNGLRRIAEERPDLVEADFAILMEPSDGVVEAGCQGTLRAEVRTSGVRAHSARSWHGRNAIHAAAPVLARLAEHQAREVDVDGLTYHEGLNAVAISGGVASNVIPDECTVTVNYRFAPDRDEAQAEAYVREVFAGFDVVLTDSAPGARPGLDAPLPSAFAAAVGGEPRAKLGWTDVARFGPLGVPAVNLGPGDPNLAHKPEEHVSCAQIREVEAALVRFLSCG